MNLRLSRRFSLWLAACLLAAPQGPALAQTAGQAPGAQPSASASPGPKPDAAPDQSAGPDGSSHAKKKAAEKKPAEEPDTIILSDTLHYNEAKKTSVFTGNVILTRGLMTLRPERKSEVKGKSG